MKQSYHCIVTTALLGKFACCDQCDHLSKARLLFFKIKQHRYQVVNDHEDDDDRIPAICHI